MESIWFLSVMFLVVLLLIASGMWISVALGVVGVGMLVFFVGGGKLSGIGMLQFNTVNTFSFIALPLFLFMGEIILHAKISEKFYKAATSWVGFLPGGLLHTNIAACTVFSAISGASMATAAAIGMVAIPEMEKRGYDRPLLLGSLACGGTLGILIPPSMAMILYGCFVGESVGQLFMGGVFPGLIMASLFMLYIAGVSLLRPGKVPQREKFSLKTVVFSSLQSVPIVLLIFMVLGTIYLGVATPSEAAAMGALFSLILCAAYRRLTWRVLKGALLAAVEITSWLLLIVIGAKVIAMALAYLQIPQALAEGILLLGVDRIVLLVIISLMYIALGCFMDGISMMLLTLPVFYPMLMTQGFSSIWVGILLVILIEIGQITPPMGVNLYVIHGITGKKYLGDILKGAIPFVIIMVFMIVIITAFPEVVLWLPRQMF